MLFMFVMTLVSVDVTIVIFFLCLFFFFFKQKTAYEMRISDWSSDVCSSDLLSHESLLVRCRSSPLRSWCLGNRQPSHSTTRHFSRQIGRASCRDRVCPYV